MIQQQNYFHRILGEAEGFVGHLLLPDKDTGQDVSKKMLSIDAVYHSTFNGSNQFLTLNTFCSALKSSIQYLQNLNALYIDLDIYNVNISVDEALKKLCADFFGKCIPFPSFVVFSGQGLYLIWCIDAENPEKLPVWNAVMHELLNRLNPLGADNKCIDASRVLRIPGTINAKPNVRKTAYVVNAYDNKYTLDEICDWLEMDTINSKEKAEVNFEIQKQFTVNGKGHAGQFRRTAKNRMDDVEKILLQKGENVEGYREIGLWIYQILAREAGFSQEATVEKMCELNQRLALPLSEEEAVRSTKSATSRRYQICSDKILQLLNVSPKVQKNLKSVISKGEWNLRHRKRKTIPPEMSRLDESLAKVKTIREMKCKGVTIKAIAKHIGVSRAACYKLLKNHPVQENLYIHNSILKG